MTQSHGSNLWRESSGSGAIPTATALYHVRGTSAITLSRNGPAAFAFFDPAGNGTRQLLDLTPVYLVASGGTYVPSLIGPAAAVFVDNGAGAAVLSTDLTQTPVADLMYDVSGDLWFVLRARKRYEIVKVHGTVKFY